MNKLVLFWLFVAQGLLLGQGFQPTPSEVARVGVYAWDGLPSCGPDALIDAARAVKELGSSKVRIYAGPYWNYECSQDLSPLDIRVQRGPYQYVFKSGWFEEIVMTVYDSSSMYWAYKTTASVAPTGFKAFSARESHSRGFGSVIALAEHLGRGSKVEDWAQTREELKRAAEVIACSVLDGTRVVLSNWEAGNDVRDPRLWPIYVAYLQARVDGINQGRARAYARGCKGQVSAAFEFIDPPSFPRGGFEQSDFVGIGSKLTGLDILSYSAWRTLDTPTEFLSISVKSAVLDILSFAADHGMPGNLLFGEFGNPRTIHPDFAQRMAIVIISALQEGASGLYYWNLQDQIEFGEHGEFKGDIGLRDKRGQLTPFGLVFAEWTRQVFSTTPVIRPVR